MGGALAGALVATHALLSIKRPPLPWHVVPAGLAHGAILAIVAASVAWLAVDRGQTTRILSVPLAGWAGGLLSWVPLAYSLKLPPAPTPLWPNLLWGPFFNFGLVSALAVLGWAVLRQLWTRRLVVHLAVASVSAVLGSMWFWVAWASVDGFPFYWYEIPHGVTWGCFVALAAWSAVRRVPPPAAEARTQISRVAGVSPNRLQAGGRSAWTLVVRRRQRSRVEPGERQRFSSERPAPWRACEIAVRRVPFPAPPPFL